MKKILSIFLICSFLFCFCTVNSFAYTEYTYIPITDFSIDMYTQEANQGGVITHYNNTIVTRGPVNIGGVTYYGIKNTDSNFAGTGKTHNCLVYKLQDLSIKDEYNINFSTRINASCTYSISVFLTDSNGQYLAVLGYDNRPAVASQVLVTDFNFSLDGLNINSNQGVFLNIETQYGSQYSGNFEFLITPVTLTNLDDDTGFFESIINWIRQTASNVTQIGSNIVSSVSNGLTNLGNNLNTWLTGVKDGITNKLESVKTSIQNSIDNIQNWFVNLGDRISDFFTMLKNYLLYFKNPVTVNADGVPVDNNGNPVYTNPFESALDEVEETINGWIDDINDFIDSIDESAETVAEPLQMFKNAISRFGNGAPFFVGLLVFAVVFFVIRKIIGR